MWSDTAGFRLYCLRGDDLSEDPSRESLGDKVGRSGTRGRAAHPACRERRGVEGKIWMWLDELISRIGSLDEEAMRAARTRQQFLSKPRGSLGRLEDLSIQIAGITGKALPALDRKVVVAMAGDHGIVAEGVSAYPQLTSAWWRRCGLAAAW